MNAHVYFVRTKDNANLIKIGVARDVKARVETLQTANHSALEILGSIPVASHRQALHLERQLHDLFRYYRVRGEWFRASNPVRSFIVSVTQLGMPITEASAIAVSESEKHKGEYYNRVNHRNLPRRYGE